MNENRAEAAPGKAEGVEGDARKLAGKAEDRMHEVSGEGQQTIGGAEDTPGEAAGNTADELARLRGYVETLLNERVKPALGKVVNTTEGYVSEARTAVQVRAGHAAAAIQERPLTIVAAIGACAFLVGRLTSATHVHHHSHS